MMRPEYAMFFGKREAKKVRPLTENEQWILKSYREDPQREVERARIEQQMKDLAVKHPDWCRCGADDCEPSKYDHKP